MEALRASIGQKGGKAAAAPGKAGNGKAEKPAKAADAIPAGALKERKPVKRAPKVLEEVAAAPARTRARK